VRRSAWLGTAVAFVALPVLTAPPAPAVRTPSLRVAIVERVAEGDVARAVVVLDEAVGHDVTVRVDTRAGTALAPADYRAVHRRVTVPAGETTVPLELSTVDDRLDEGPEDLRLRLSGASGAEIAHRMAELVIRDRDPLPHVRVREATFTEPTLGHRLGFTRVTLSAPSGRRVQVDFATRGGSATAGQDFVPLHPTVVFDPGDTTALVSVELLSDSRVEPAETVRVAVTAVRHATATRGATMTILDAPGGLHS
jgi:hypothetical protein